MLAERGPGEPIRAWSAGCASGQEAYTLAMLLAEAMGPDAFRQRVKIYTTDIDEEALAEARTASYAAKAVEGVPQDLLARYFEQVNSRYVFQKDLRRAVIFGRNDLVKDAPISRVDLLVCRNTLMYLNAETRRNVLERLHFALAPQGTLFLGHAEMLLSHSDRFAPPNLKNRIFRKVAGARLGVRVQSAGRCQQDHQLDRRAARVRRHSFSVHSWMARSQCSARNRGHLCRRARGIRRASSRLRFAGAEAGSTLG
jgi:two-component system, chemotaxis family, CheB/CheR fusion protein